MISGFNTNVRHRGLVFHVQTEDSGRAYPHIITHLYYQGTILASEKSEYRDRLDSPNLGREVKERMEAQHQAMLDRVGQGEFDPLVAERFGADVFAEGTTASLAVRQPAPERARDACSPGEAQPRHSAQRSGSAKGAERGRAKGAAGGASAPEQKPLDELILDYLVESARKRRAQ
jgi:hypothetical protein